MEKSHVPILGTSCSVLFTNWESRQVFDFVRSNLFWRQPDSAVKRKHTDTQEDTLARKDKQDQSRN